MRAVDRESEAIQQIVDEATALLKKAYEKLEEASDQNGVMQVHGPGAAECIAQAQYDIEVACAWLNKEESVGTEILLRLIPKRGETAPCG